MSCRETHLTRDARGLVMLAVAFASVMTLLSATACSPTEIGSSMSGQVNLEGSFTGGGYEEYYVGGDMMHIEDGWLTFRDFVYDVSSASTIDAYYQDTYAKIWVDDVLVYEGYGD